MNRCDFSADASRDLHAIFDSIAKDDLLAAKRILDRIHALCDLIPSQPQMGRDRSPLISGMRSITLKPYTVYYRAHSDGIEVLRILHGRRDIRDIMDKQTRT